MLVRGPRTYPGICPNGTTAGAPTAQPKLLKSRARGKMPTGYFETSCPSGWYQFGGACVKLNR
jgi:hypothetical protein